MITTSAKWNSYIQDNNNFQIKAVLTLEDGTVFNLTGDDFMSASITDAISDKDSLQIGAVITNRFSGSLNNMEDKFSGADLEGATLAVKVGLIYEDDTEEWIDRGTFFLDAPETIAYAIPITGYDSMDKLNRYYIGKTLVSGDLVDIVFPIASSDLIMALCDYCGVPYAAATIWGLSNDLTINEFEYNESTTCRQVINWVLQLNAGYGRVNNIGNLECKWIGGGNWAIDKVFASTVAISDVTITGVRAYAYGTVDEFQFDTAGNDGYIIALQDNPLITSANMSTIANTVYNSIGNLTFRPFDSQVMANPAVEAGDLLTIADYKGTMHSSFITNLSFSIGSNMSISCGAESVSKKDLELSNPRVSVIAGATRAAYDYIMAKKISADYVSAGTLTGAVIAKNFTMEGGSIDVTVDSDTESIINLQYNETIGGAVYTDNTTLKAKELEFDYTGTYQGTTNTYLTSYNHWGMTINANIQGVNYETTLSSLSIAVGPVASPYFAATNEGIFINDEKMADFVIDEGIDGAWYVRKWANGRLEMWIENFNLGSTAITSAYGNGFFTNKPNASGYYMYGTNIGAFVDPPQVICTMKSSTGLIGCSPRYITNTGYQLFIWSLSSITVSPELNVYVAGKWK